MAVATTTTTNNTEAPNYSANKRPDYNGKVRLPRVGPPKKTRLQNETPKKSACTQRRRHRNVSAVQKSRFSK